MTTPRDQFAAAHGEKAADEVQRKMVQDITVSLGEILVSALQQEDASDMLGFTLIVFEYGDHGSMAYASTAASDEFLRLLDELRGKLAARLPNAPKGD